MTLREIFDNFDNWSKISISDEIKCSLFIRTIKDITDKADLFFMKRSDDKLTTTSGTTIYPLSAIVDIDGNTAYIKRVIKLYDSSDNEYREWEIMGDKIIMEDDPGDDTWKVRAVHYVRPLNIDTYNDVKAGTATYNIDIPTAHHNTILDGMKYFSEIDEMGISTPYIADNYNNSKKSCIADYDGSRDKQNNIDLYDVLDDGTEIERW